jgi:VIT1/CCC1 family predicted Fe2+/Mn2+ transporter
MPTQAAARKRVEEHLRAEHRISPISEFLKEIVYGGSDGIVTTFAVVAGFTGAQSGGTIQYSILTVLLFGLANLFADAASMGLGDYMSSRSEQDYYRKQKAKELQEMRTNKEYELKETEDILYAKGFSRADAAKLATIYATNESYWLDFMMNHELELPNPDGVNPAHPALATFFSFMTFGSIPLIPYILLSNSGHAFSYSVLFSLSALVILGTLRWRVTRQHPVRSIAETVLLGSIAGGIAFLVGMFFRG